MHQTGLVQVIGDGVMLSQPEDGSEDYAQGLDTVSFTTNGNQGSESSGMDDTFLQSSLSPPPVKKKGKVKSTGTTQSTYDPQTCHTYFWLTVVLFANDFQRSSSHVLFTNQMAQTLCSTSSPRLPITSFVIQ